MKTFNFESNVRHYFIDHTNTQPKHLNIKFAVQYKTNQSILHPDTETETNSSIGTPLVRLFGLSVDL